MLSRRNAAIVTGGLFLIATLFGAISLAFSGSLSSPNYLVEIYHARTQVAFGILVVVIMTIAIVAIPVVLAPIFKVFDERSAIAYIVLRSLEGVAYLPLIVGRLLLIALSRDYVASESPALESYEVVGGLLHDLEVQASTVSTVFFGLGALVFYSLLWRSRLLPRWLSGWGFAGGLLACAAAVFGLFDIFSANLAVLALLWSPIAINELVLAAWLILKGFRPDEARS